VYLYDAQIGVLTVTIAYHTENIRNLTGRSATPEELQLITYLVYDFHPLIQKIDTVRAYYSGNGLLIEGNFLYLSSPLFLTTVHVSGHCASTGY
jgi:ADP-glucose pyrophosphorylase